MQRIVLASTSAYRRDLLARLGLPFEVAAPKVEEGALAGESPRITARRLAQAKAVIIACEHPDAIVIGSDQVADLDGVPLNKPGSHDAALEQLLRLQGQRAVFHTAVAVATAGGNRVRSTASTRPYSFAASADPGSTPTCASTSRTTARERRRSKRWASRSSSPCSATIRLPSSACR
jgi:predicted house-cleaning NTP pyrophosphatase (Maf/HAM1 superfamily)